MSITLKRSCTMFVLSAPSGGGKSTVVRAVLRNVRGLAYSISVTSRPPRAHERDGVDFHFVTQEKFQERIQRQEFYEWALVHGNCYGTPKAPIAGMLAEGKDVVLDIDVQGARSVKSLRPDAVTIFLLPPSSEVLERRLRDRGTETDETIRVRLANATEEIAASLSFDYLVINDSVERAVAEIRGIIEAERNRAAQQELLLSNEPALEARLGKSRASH